MPWRRGGVTKRFVGAMVLKEVSSSQLSQSINVTCKVFLIRLRCALRTKKLARWLPNLPAVHLVILNAIVDTHIWVRFLCICTFLLHQIIEILQLMCAGYSAKSSHMKSLTTINANVC